MKPARNSGLQSGETTHLDPAGRAGPPGVRTGVTGKRAPTSTRLEDERGIALILAILLLTLLASFGLWLMVESQNELKMAQSNERREETFHLAESACWLGVHALDALSLSLPTTSSFTNVTPTSVAYLAANQTIQNMTSSTFRFSPGIFSSRYFYNTTPPTGWMLNWQGSTGYYTAFFLCRGQGFVQLPDAKGSSISTLFTFVGKPVR